MILRIRTILDVNDDVIRDIEIEDDSTLEDLNIFITKSYGFKEKEMASFFKTDENWKQGEEMNLIELDEKKNFSKKTLNSILNKSNKRLIFIYDFLALWTFFIEVIEFTQPIKNTSYPNLIFSKGKIPKKPPNNIIINSKEKDQTENFDDLSDYELY
tara:strand:+ start:5586 stop:6056 length:471 start_codon:yes stop_codon:yes gene_type:complete